MSAGQAISGLELVGSPGGEDGVLFGLWRSTGLASATPGEPTIWKVDLAVTTAASLASSRVRLTAAEGTLPSAVRRFENVVKSGGAHLSFSTDVAEHELATWLAEADATSPGVAFGPAEVGAERGWWGEQRQAAVAFAEQLGRWCGPWTWVETHAGERQLGRSLVNVGGGVRSVLMPGATSDQLDRHGCSVELALASRLAVIRTVGVAVRGAVAISARLALPGGPLLAIPVAWRFFHRALSLRAVAPASAVVR